MHFNLAGLIKKPKIIKNVIIKLHSLIFFPVRPLSPLNYIEKLKISIKNFNLVLKSIHFHLTINYCSVRIANEFTLFTVDLSSFILNTRYLIANPPTRISVNNKL